MADGAPLWPRGVMAAVGLCPAAFGRGRVVTRSGDAVGVRRVSIVCRLCEEVRRRTLLAGCSLIWVVEAVPTSFLGDSTEGPANGSTGMEAPALTNGSIGMEAP